MSENIFTFKARRDLGANLRQHTIGMESFLGSFLKRAGIKADTYGVFLVKSCPHALPEKGIKLVSHDEKKTLCLKIYAHETPFKVQLTATGDKDVVVLFDQLAKILNSNRFITEKELFPKKAAFVNLNPLSFPESDLVLEKKTSVNGSALKPGESSEFKLKVFNASPADQAIFLDALRTRVGGCGEFTTADLGAVIMAIYRVASLGRMTLALMTTSLRRKGFSVPSGNSKPPKYILTKTTEEFLVKHSLIRRDQVVRFDPSRVMPVLPRVEKKSRRVIKSSSTPFQTTPSDVSEPDSGGNFNVAISKAQALLAELSSVEEALEACTARRQELQKKREELDVEIASVEEKQKSFQASLENPKYIKAKGLMEALKQFS